MTACRVPAELLADFAGGVLQRAGMPDDVAGRLARYLIRADMRGVHSHGLDLLGYYSRGLMARGLDPTARPEVVHRRGCVAVVDGHGGLGYETSRVGMGLACDMAADMGVGVVTARGSNHFGMAAHWSLQALEAGMVGLVTTNGPPALAHWGSRDVLMSNNPFSWGIPAGRELPIVLDAACSETARGKIRLAASRGEQIPPDWALGPDGLPTTDPRAALDGALLPFGGAKGSGIAIVNEVLSSAFSGAHMLTQIAGLAMGSPHAHDAWGNGHFFLALDPGAFGPATDFADRVDVMITSLRNAAVAPGHEPILMPGERAFEAERIARADGVLLAPATDRSLRRLSDLVGLDPTW